MTILCERRQGKKEPGAARLVPREALALALLAEAGSLTTAQYAAFLELSPRVARRSLQKLRSLDLVRVFLTALHEQNRVCITERGKSAIVRAFGLDPLSVFVPRNLGKDLAHRDMIVDAAIALTLGAARSNQWSIVERHFERSLRKRLGSVTTAQVPDLAFIFEHRSGEQRAFAVEADIGTETPSWLREHKFLPYSAFHESGTPLLGVSDFRVGFVVPSEKRLGKLAAAAWEAGAPEGLFYFTTSSALRSEVALTSAWKTPRAVGESARLVEESPFAVAPLAHSSVEKHP